MRRLRDHEKMEPILEFLREHGSSDVLTMKLAGIEIPHGLVNRMHSEGLIKKVGKKDHGNSHWTWIWAVM